MRYFGPISSVSERAYNGSSKQRLNVRWRSFTWNRYRLNTNINIAHTRSDRPIFWAVHFIAATTQKRISNKKGSHDFQWISNYFKENFKVFTASEFILIQCHHEFDTEWLWIFWQNFNFFHDQKASSECLQFWFTLVWSECLHVYVWVCLSAHNIQRQLCEPTRNYLQHCDSNHEISNGTWKEISASRFAC